MVPRSLSVIALLGALACAPSAEEIANGVDPIASLGATVSSSRYGEQYWRKQRDAKSDLWARAVEYCEPSESANYPNCEVVSALKFLTTPDAAKDPARSEEGLRF